MKRGIKGQLVASKDENTIRYIQENDEVFKAVCARDFDCVLEWDIYEAEYESNDVIGIDFNILSDTFKNTDKYYSLFKKELKNHFGFKTIHEILKLKYDKI